MVITDNFVTNMFMIVDGDNFEIPARLKARTRTKHLDELRLSTDLGVEKKMTGYSK